MTWTIMCVLNHLIALCEPYLNRKHTRSSFKPKKEVSTFRVLKLVHIDLMGPSRHASLSDKLFNLVIVDAFSQFTWVGFLANKSDAFNEFAKRCNWFKMRRINPSLQLEPIMENNLNANHLRTCMINMASNTTFWQ